MTSGDEWAAAALRAHRNAKGMTQQQLAEASGLDRAVVIALEKGRRRISRYYADVLGAALNVNPDELIAPPEDDRSEGAQMSPLDRLEVLEAEVEQLRSERDAALRAVVARLAVVEAAQEIAAPREAPGRSENPRTKGQR